jgi:glucosylglycerate synthase
MTTENANSDISPSPEQHGASLLVFLAAMPAEQLASAIDNLASAFHSEDILVAVPGGSGVESNPALKVVEAPKARPALTLTAADFVGACELAQQNNVQAVLMLGQQSATLRPSALRDLAGAVLAGSADLAVPCYELPPSTGLVNSAILYPLTRALFAARARFPLAVDLGLSLRMIERAAAAARPLVSLNEDGALLWPVNEAAVAGFTIAEFSVGTRDLVHPAEPDINAVLTSVIGSLFADVEAKAASWQRPRQLQRSRCPISNTAIPDSAADIAPMIDAFRLAYTNLQEIWSLVLPPNSLLGLRRVSSLGSADFRMPDSLWARIVFDFLIAYRLRTINRGHLLGALIPLYLAWVASHINTIASGTESETHIEAVAAAFEADKSYLVARWRWPDRFNP